jgi:hypothetical protein
MSRRRAFRPALPPEPGEGFRVVTGDPLVDRTFATLSDAEQALAVYHALGITDARVLEWPQRPTDWAGQPVYTLPERKKR